MSCPQASTRKPAAATTEGGDRGRSRCHYVHDAWQWVTLCTVPMPVGVAVYRSRGSECYWVLLLTAGVTGYSPSDSKCLPILTLLQRVSLCTHRVTAGAVSRSGCGSAPRCCSRWPPGGPPARRRCTAAGTRWPADRPASPQMPRPSAPPPPRPASGQSGAPAGDTPPTRPTRSWPHPPLSDRCAHTRSDWLICSKGNRGRMPVRRSVFLVVGRLVEREWEEN